MQQYRRAVIKCFDIWNKMKKYKLPEICSNSSPALLPRRTYFVYLIKQRGLACLGKGTALAFMLQRVRRGHMSRTIQRFFIPGTNIRAVPLTYPKLSLCL